MSLRLLDADGSLNAWAPSAPPRARVRAEAKGAGPLTYARARSVTAAACAALSFLGYEAGEDRGAAADLSVSTSAGPGPRLFVAASSTEQGDFESRGFSWREFHYLCLKTHPRKPLAFSWDALAEARAELSALQAAAGSLAAVTLEPSSRGVTGYQHRFREALSRDFDFPEALSCVWDGLRPGALSPGSRAAFLRAALPALGLD